MAEGDNALRAEIEKVRERTRLQALAQGMSPDEAEARAGVAVAEFCTRWGIKPEMLGPAPPRPARGQPAPAPDPRPASVDLGSSPLRSMSGGQNKTQAIRIGDLLKRTQAPAPPAAGSAAPAPSSTGSNLSAFLQKVRSKPLTEAPAPPAPHMSPPPPAASRTPASSAAGAPRTASPPIQIRNVPVHQQVGAPRRGPAPAPAPAAASPASLVERRKQILDEFDRTYNEVQSMLEARIGIDAVALGQTDGSGLASGAGGYSPEEMQAIARDLERLMGGLGQMMTLCQELMDHIGGFIAKGAEPPGGLPPEDGAS